MLCLFVSCHKQKDHIFPENGLLVSGTVFEDLNRNGIMETGEKGITGVLVSNQRDVVKTDKNGKYHLPLENNMTIYVSKPAGYDYLTDANNLPRFFYHHYPHGSPDTLNYPGIPASGDLPGSVDFPLVKSRFEQEFTFIALGDPQPRSDEELSYFRDLVVANIPHASADFSLVVGDVMFDNLDLYPRYNEILAQLNMPAFNLPGNHDLNFETGAEHCFDTFKRYFGPDYYSFSYGQAHFIILNTVIWDGKKTQTWWGDYHGGILPVQMTWLENILQHIPEDKLIIFAGHIPMYWELHTTDQHHVKNREDFFKLLKGRNHLLFLAGHMHTNEYSYFKPEHGWMGAADFLQIICGAVCGTWWGGPKHRRGFLLQFSPTALLPDISDSG